MKINDLKEIKEKSPSKGYLLLYSRKESPVFRSYMSVDEVLNDYDERDILEIHLFDKNKEYRALERKGKYKPGIIEHTADFKYSEDHVFREEMLLEKKIDNTEKIIIFNHIAYDEDGIASVVDYRMVPGGDK